MIKELSCGGVIFIRENNEILYLLLYKKANLHYKEVWGFPRGLNEGGESFNETALREIKEETSLYDLKLIKGFEEKLKWVYKKDGMFAKKEAIYFLFESKTKDVKISNEHTSFKWCKYEEALKLVKFDKIILKKAHEILSGGLNKFI